MRTTTLFFPPQSFVEIKAVACVLPIRLGLPPFPPQFRRELWWPSASPPPVARPKCRLDLCHCHCESNLQVSQTRRSQSKPFSARSDLTFLVGAAHNSRTSGWRNAWVIVRNVTASNAAVFLSVFLGKPFHKILDHALQFGIILLYCCASSCVKTEQTGPSG